MSMMKQERVGKKHLLLISLLLLVFTTGDMDTDTGTFIESNLTFLFNKNRSIANQCLNCKLLDKIHNEENNQNLNVTDKPCKNLIEDNSFAWDYLQINISRVLWYPIIHCYTTNNCISVKESFQNCNKTSPHIMATYMSTLPWKCGFQENTRNYSKTFVYLHIYNQKLLSNCTDLLCMGGYSHLSNVTFINLTDSKADNCANKLETSQNSSFCYKNEKLCFHQYNIPYIQKGIAFITKDTNNLTETQKKVIILSKFTMLKDSPWCKHPLDYTTQARIIQNVYQTFFYCYGDKNETDTSDSWVIAHISEKESIVALNGNVNPLTISSNVMLQALIATNVIINTTVYKSFETSSITLKYHTELFNIPVFNDSQLASNELLQMIKVENCTVKSEEENCTVKSKTNKYVTTVTDGRSFWSPMNWIIIHNCSNHGRDKDLFLFWYNDTDRLGSICNKDTVVLLTTIRRASVSFIDIGRIRSCNDGSLHNSSSEHCQSLIKDGSDYETRFFQFLVYQKTLDKKSLIKNLTGKFEEGYTNQTFILTFGFNTHPDLRGGILDLTKTFKSNTSTNISVEENNLSKSIEKILQIFLIASLTNNTDCLEDIKNDRFSIDITDDENSNKVYEISPVAPEVSSASCLRILPLGILKDLQAISFNKFWPTCIYNKLVAWNNTVKNVPEWDYLPKECKIMESILFAVVLIITVTTITGNILVITIIIASKLVEKHAFMLYTSLALADLLIGITSSLLAVIDTHSLMNGQLTMYNLTVNGTFGDFQRITNEQLEGFKGLRFRREGWPAFTGIAMNISIMSSLMSLALLGIDRLLMLKMLSFKDKHIRIAIITTWIWNITCSLLISIQVEEKENHVIFVSYFDPITKLTLNIGTQESVVSSIVFKIQLFIGGIAGIIVVIASIASMIVYNFVESKNNQQAVRIHDQRRGEKIQVVTRTFLMMVLLFLVSCSPIAYTIITKTFTESVTENVTPCVTENDTDFSIHPVFHFIIWWLCVAGSSWNWLIYSFRGTYFKQEAKKLWHKFF